MTPSFSAEKFDPNIFDRGSKHRGVIEVDSDLNFPVLLARGERLGPTLVVSANVHGDEYEGVRAIFEVFEELNPARMSGDLLAVPIVNVPAFWNGTRTSPLDGANLARVFPGDPTGSSSYRRAWHFGRAIIARASFYLDLHSGGVQFRMPSMAGYSTWNPQSCAAAEIFGAPVIWGHPSVPPGRTVSFANDLQIPWLYTEARGAGRIHREDLSMMKRGIRNLLCHLRILDEALDRVPVTLRLHGDGNTDCGISAAQAGFLMTRVEILEPVATGQMLGKLVGVTGQTLEEYRAPAGGRVGLIREFPVVRSGDVLFLITQEAREA